MHVGQIVVLNGYVVVLVLLMFQLFAGKDLILELFLLVSFHVIPFVAGLL